MRYLITGGAGFVGSHLAESLLRRGDEVVVIDNLSTGSIRNIEHLKGIKQFEYVIESMENERLLAELVDGVDSIFHLAAAVGVKLIVQSPVYTIETNVHLTELLLASAVKKRKKVFLASTSEVYGKNPQVPFFENSDLVMGPTTRGRWSYACSKALDEFLAIAYWREKRLPVVIGRLFNTVGPRQTGQYGMVLPTFARQAVNNLPVTVHGDGSQSRCFTHVADAVRAMIGLMDANNVIGEVFNIGQPEEVTIKDLAHKVVKIARSDSRVEFVPYDEVFGDGFEDMSRRVPSIAKIAQTIGYKPEHNLASIIESVVEWARVSKPPAPTPISIPAVPA